MTDNERYVFDLHGYLVAETESQRRILATPGVYPKPDDGDPHR